jgi:hypothetical protein
MMIHPDLASQQSSSTYVTATIPNQPIPTSNVLHILTKLARHKEFASKKSL